jgi:hypothetical protein
VRRAFHAIEFYRTRFAGEPELRLARRFSRYRSSRREVGMSAGLLEGLIVLDMSQFLSGPFAALRLGDLGARVIKIERPDGGVFAGTSISPTRRSAETPRFSTPSTAASKVSRQTSRIPPTLRRLSG